MDGPNQPVNDKPIREFLGRERMPIATRLLPIVFAGRHDQLPITISRYEPDTREAVQHVMAQGVVGPGRIGIKEVWAKECCIHIVAFLCHAHLTTSLKFSDLLHQICFGSFGSGWLRYRYSEGVLILVAVECTVLISIRPAVKCSLLALLFAVFSVTATVTTGPVITTAPVDCLGLPIRLPLVLPAGMVIVEAHLPTSKQPM
jgi:hypothetical protein